MEKLVFATNNPHKLQEIRQMLEGLYEVVSLQDVGIHEDIPETADTLEGNALQKAEFVHSRLGLNVFADDTGLEIKALNGEPGVYSARYAGPACSPEDNMVKVLTQMAGETDREARFRTAIALILKDEVYHFEGEVDGVILEAKTGEKGFGYDPIFRPTGFDLSFAQMPAEQKNEISHRGRAVQKLMVFLKTKAE